MNLSALFSPVLLSYSAPSHLAISFRIKLCASNRLIFILFIGFNANDTKSLEYLYQYRRYPRKLSSTEALDYISYLFLHSSTS